VDFGIFAALKGRGPLYMVPARTTALGRRQVVRHWILIPAFEGSIPSAPASRQRNAREARFTQTAVPRLVRGTHLRSDFQSIRMLPPRQGRSATAAADGILAASGGPS
jgi:hypothetical protein